MAAFDEALDEGDHLGDARGGPWLVGGALDAQQIVGRCELSLDAIGQGPRLFGAGCRGVIENLVVDIG